MPFKSTSMPLRWVLVALALATIVSSLLVVRPGMDVWPDGVTKIDGYTDSSEGGRSRLSLDTAGGGSLRVELVLDSGAAYPLSGVLFERDSVPFDASGAGWFELDIVATDLASLEVCLMQDLPGFTQPGIWYSARYLCQVLEVVPGQSPMRFELESFETPSWWYPVAGLRPSQLGPQRRDRILRFAVQPGPGVELGKKRKLEIRAIRVTRSWGPVLAMVWLPLVVVSGWLFWSRQRERSSFPQSGEASSPLEAAQSEPTTSTTKEADAIVRWIATNYPSPDLSLESVSFATGVPSERIAFHLRSVSGLMFKSYLNTVRVEAATRLLAQTDLPVAEIASKVGYGNVSHFNRVFREITSKTPTSLRSKPIAT